MFEKSKEYYYVNFYDAFDGSGEVGFNNDRTFNSYKDAKRCEEYLNAKLDSSNKQIGEKYYIVTLYRNENIVLKEKLEYLINL